MVQIYYEITIYIYKEILHSPGLSRMDECTLFQGVKSSWGIKMIEKTKAPKSRR
jgi:hypothetical protein